MCVHACMCVRVPVCVCVNPDLVFASALQWQFLVKMYVQTYIRAYVRTYV